MDLPTRAHGKSDIRNSCSRHRRWCLNKGGSAGLRGCDITELRSPCLSSRKTCKATWNSLYFKERRIESQERKWGKGRGRERERTWFHFILKSAMLPWKCKVNSSGKKYYIVSPIPFSYRTIKIIFFERLNSWQWHFKQTLLSLLKNK